MHAWQLLQLAALDLVAGSAANRLPPSVKLPAAPAWICAQLPWPATSPAKHDVHNCDNHSCYPGEPKCAITELMERKMLML